MKKSIFTTITFLLFTLNLTAQTFTTITNNKHIFDIEREANTLWVATNGGVLKWDLTTQTHEKITTSEGLIGNAVSCISIDAEGGKWFGTNQGVSHLSANEQWTHYTHFNAPITAMDIDSEGSIWVGANKHYNLGGLYRLKNGEWTAFLDGPSQYHNQIESLVIDANDNVWMSFPNATTRLDTNEEWTLIDGEGGGINRSNNMVADDLGNVWAMTLAGLKVYDSEGNRTVYDAYQGHWGLGGAVTIDADNNKWLGTVNGVVRFNESSPDINYTTSDGLISDYVTSIFVDDEGNKWFGTIDEISRLSNDDSWSNYTTPDGLFNHNILSLVADNNNKMWFGTDIGLATYDAGNWTNLEAENGLDCLRFADLKVDNDGTVWGAHSMHCQGITKISPNGDIETIVHDSILFALSIQPDNEGNIWTGHYSEFIQEGINVTQIKPDGTMNLYAIVNDFNENGKVTNMLLEDNGTVWFTSRQGIAKYENGVMETVRQGGYIAVGMDTQGNKWFSKGDYFGPFGSGVLRLGTDGIWTAFTDLNGLIDNRVNAIVGDNEGNVWFGGNNGLSKYDTEGNWTNYTTLNGIADNQIIDLKLDRNGFLWIATPFGVSTTSTVSTAVIETPTTNTMDIQVFPNPYSEQIQFAFELNKTSQIQIEVYTLLGQKVATIANTNLNAGQHQFDFSGKEKGVYILQMVIDGQVHHRKFMKF